MQSRGRELGISLSRSILSLFLLSLHRHVTRMFTKLETQRRWEEIKTGWKREFRTSICWKPFAFSLSGTVCWFIYLICPVLYLLFLFYIPLNFHNSQQLCIATYEDARSVLVDFLLGSFLSSRTLFLRVPGKYKATVFAAWWYRYSADAYGFDSK